MKKVKLLLICTSIFFCQCKKNEVEEAEEEVVTQKSLLRQGDVRRESGATSRWRFGPFRARTGRVNCRLMISGCDAADHVGSASRNRESMLKRSDALSPGRCQAVVFFPSSSHCDSGGRYLEV